MSPDDLVWYVAYGSNLLRERFLAYLSGGSGPGGSGHHDGARDTSMPVDDRPVRIDRQLIFTGLSKRWGGGVCAVVRSADAVPECLGRAWLITTGQLVDVWRQENGGQGLPDDTISWSTLDQHGHVDHPSGRYRRLDRLDSIDGMPALTITCGPEMLAEQNPPTVPYLDMVAAGLAETWQLAPHEAGRYLMSHSVDASADHRPGGAP